MTPIHLSKNMTPRARLRIILGRLDELGYKVVIGDDESKSWTDPIRRTIWLQKGAKVNVSYLTLLAHELAHAESQGRELGGRIWFAFAYLGAAILGIVATLAAVVFSVVPWDPRPILALPFAWALVVWSDAWRGAEEIEGEAHEAAMRARLNGDARPVAKHKLGGLRRPYFLVGSPERYSKAIERRASELLDV